MKLFRTAAVALATALLATSALAAPLAYINPAFDTPNSAANAVITAYNAAAPSAQYTVSCTGTTTSTCSGLKIVTSYSGLTTAAGVTSAAQTVTNTSVTAASLIFCQAVGYAGTGNPIIANVIPGAGSFTYLIQNTHASAALNATVPVACLVYN